MLGAFTGLGTPGIVLAALLLGALGFLNTWDFPIYVGLATLAIGAGLALTVGLTRGVVARALGAGIVLGVLGWLLYLPFYIGFQSQLGGVLPNLLFPSRFSQFSVMFGLFLVVILFFLILLSRQAPGRDLRRGFLGVFPWVLLTPLALVAFFLLVFTVLPQGRAFANTFLDNPAVKAAVGDRSVGQLAALIARLRLASPWTYLILAGLLGWVGGLLWAQLHRESRAEAETTTGEGDAPAPPLPRSPVHARVPDIFALLHDRPGVAVGLQRRVRLLARSLRHAHEHGVQVLLPGVGDAGAGRRLRGEPSGGPRGILGAEGAGAAPDHPADWPDRWSTRLPPFPARQAISGVRLRSTGWLTCGRAARPMLPPSNGFEPTFRPTQLW